MLVTLDVFSGRPNPSWELSDSDAKSFMERVANRAVAAAEGGDNGLGYRGIILSATRSNQLPDGLPTDFRIGGASTNASPADSSGRPYLSVDESDDAVRWLLSKGGSVLDESVVTHVEEALRMRGNSGRSPSASNEDGGTGLLNPTGCTIQNPSYNPGFWNVPSTQPNNNCYNFAMNYRSNTFAQPGRQTGHQYTALVCANVSTAAQSDGNKLACSGPSKNVALVIWPGQDFHWYARQSQGFWAHKPGQTVVRNVDNSGRVIDGTTLTPANCNRGPYSNFCGYMFSPIGIVVK